MAKSQMLKYLAKLSPRGIFTSGAGSSGAGLSAAIVHEPDGTIYLQAGALVLADKGACMIDEFDKIKQEERNMVHEALEQRTVSIAKAGITATLNARCSVLAACNPILGRYNDSQNLNENVNLPPTLLSRFDFVFVLRNIPEPKEDAAISAHILGLKTRQTKVEAPIPLELMRKYVTYARKHNPQLTIPAAQKIQEFYLKMRQVSQDGALAITARQLEGVTRLSEARAKLFLRDTVEPEDADAAIKLIMYSLQQVGVDVNTGKIDIDILLTGNPKSLRDKISVILDLVNELNRVNGEADKITLITKLDTEKHIPPQEAEKIIERLLRESILYEPREGKFLKT